MSKLLQCWKVTYSSGLVMNDYFGILEKTKPHGPAWFNIQTQKKTFRSTVKALPPLHSFSRLHESSLLHQQFPLCRGLKRASEHWELSAWCRIGVSEWERGERIESQHIHLSPLDPKLRMTHCFWSGWTHSCPPAYLRLNKMGNE